MKYRVRNFFITLALILAAYLLQYSAFIRIPVINCSPNLMLILTFAFGYVRNKNAGMLVGFFAGLFIDVFYCPVIGYNALVLMVVGFVCGSLKKVYYSDSLLCVCSSGAFPYQFIGILLPSSEFTRNVFVSGEALSTTDRSFSSMHCVK